MARLGGFLGQPLGPLLKTGLPLIRNVLSVLVPLRLTVAASATDAVIQKRIFGLRRTTLIVSNEETNDIMKIVKSLEDSDLLIKDSSETAKNETNEQKGGLLDMLLEALDAGSEKIC